MHWGDYDICSPNAVQYPLPDKRGVEWAIKNSYQLSEDISRGHLIGTIQLLGTPGLFITRVKGRGTNVLTTVPVRSVYHKIHYINRAMKDMEWFLLCDDYDTFLQTGIPIEISL